MDYLTSQFRKPVVQLVLLLFLLALMFKPVDADARGHGSRSRQPYRTHHNEFVFEGSLVMAGSELSDDYWTSDHGLSQQDGWELGCRVRHYLTPYLALSPTFHYKQFSDFTDISESGGIEISTAIFRYGLDFQQFLTPPRSMVRPYVTAGIALCHNTYQDWLEGDGYFKTNANALGVGVGFGVRFEAIEISGVYNINRFESENLPSVSTDTDYNWDNIVIRIGISPVSY